jgi:hypothetical protein
MKTSHTLAALVLCLGAQAATAPAAAGLRAKGIGPGIKIEAPAEKIWARIGNFQDMSWHPGVSKTEGTGGEELGATRILHLRSGGTVEQKLLLKEPLSYLAVSKRVDAKAFPVREFSLDVRVLKESDSKSEARLGGTITHMVADDGSDAVAVEALDQTVRDFLNAGLQSLKREIESRPE